MKKVAILITFSILLILNSCDQSGSMNKATSDTAVAVMEGDEAPSVSESEHRSEINNFNGWAKDSIKIVYGKYADTLHGFRNGDTLLVEGDIMITYDPVRKGVGTTHNLWPLKNGIVQIPYIIDPTYNDPQAIKNAIQMWETMAKVRFIKRIAEIDYVEFAPSSFTRSFIGMVTGKQKIELANWAKTGNIAHEMGHCLGLYHEQSRSDRDNFVSILCPNDINYKHAYKKDPYSKDVGLYNFYSIMHYPVNECMKVLKQLPKNIPGQRDSITQLDFATVKNIYGLK